MLLEYVDYFAVIFTFEFYLNETWLSFKVNPSFYSVNCQANQVLNKEKETYNKW